ncbi:MAG: GMC family oxidoreductase [Cyclobacteriaceae bacterium]|nr:GMC family oxidoreductase [Cyclobacteriaceae bacterium]
MTDPLNQITGEDYDAIVVGSGITGGWAAKELCEQGLRVLMLERGKPLDHPNYPGSLDAPWQIDHRSQLTQTDREQSHIQARHWSFRGENKQYYINDLENPYVEKQRFDWIRGNIVGGRSLLWSRMSFRWSDLDFEANLRDGHGVDWPVRYRDIAPWYDYVEEYIGVSGNQDGVPQLPDGKFLPPMEMNCVEIDFRQKMQTSFPDRPVLIGRVANLTKPLPGRGSCQYRNQCHRGCSFGAYFSTNSSTLPAAHATGRLTLVSNAIVNRVLYDEKKQRASGVEYIDSMTGKSVEVHARMVMLNASTLGTAFILLNSTSSRFPNGLGNGSDQVGRNIMDHHKGSGANAMVEGFDDKYYHGRRPVGIYIPRFKNLKSHSEKYLRGFGLQGGAGRGGWGDQLNSPSLGEELKAAVTSPGPWTMNLLGFGECLPHPENRVTLHPEEKDHWGRPALQMDVRFRENETTMNEEMATAAAEMLEAAGYKKVKPYRAISFPGNANHEMGSARMGRDSKTSVLNGYNQMHEVPNVFITDGSCMASSSCVNPSLTYMALTARACHYAVDEMKKRNL